MLTPIYVTFKETIRKRIESGDLAPGDKLPSERDLAAAHGLSRMTVRQALTELVTAGVLYREQGRGTFVSAHKMQQRNISSFTETVRQRGLKPETKVVSFSVCEPPAEVADMLSAKGEVYRAIRIRLADGTPVALEEIFIPMHICPGLRQNDLLGSLYSLMTDTYGHKISSADSSMSAQLPGLKLQEDLGITRQTPVLKVNSLYYATSGITLYYERGVYRTDMYEYNIRISKQSGG
jgi:GntR family transcriptional regulator